MHPVSADPERRRNSADLLGVSFVVRSRLARRRSADGAGKHRGVKICRGCSCNMLALTGDDYSTMRMLHLPDALPDVRLVNAVTLEPQTIRGGDMKIVDCPTWCAP